MTIPTSGRTFIKVIAAAAAVLAAILAAQTKAAASDATPDKQTSAMKIQITIGSKMFTATLEDNATAKAFRPLLPLTLKMTELNGNEKFFRLSHNLPTNASSPGTIHTGDLMIYGQNTVVLFYKNFPTSYSYTRLGRISDPAGLAAALGSGETTVTYEVQ